MIIKITPNKLQNLLGIPVYLVGGAVRDILIGNNPKDYDFSTPSDPQEVENAIIKIGRKPYLIGKKFGTVGFKLEYQPKQFEYIEITTFRTEKYDTNSRKPTVTFTQSMQEDMSRRDFTINAMAIQQNNDIWDEYNGQQDLKNGIIRAVGNPNQRFTEDPLRILRAVRFAAKYNFNIEDKTSKSIQNTTHKLVTVSKERWIVELDKILSSDNAKYGLNLLMDLGILNIILPILTLQKNYSQNSVLWESTLEAVNNIPKENLDLRWSALFQNIAKPFSKDHGVFGVLGVELAGQLCDYLKFSNNRKNIIIKEFKGKI